MSVHRVELKQELAQKQVVILLLILRGRIERGIRRHFGRQQVLNEVGALQLGLHFGRNGPPNGLFVHIAHIDTAGIIKENLIAAADRVDADIQLLVLRVRDKRLNQKVL